MKVDESAEPSVDVTAVETVVSMVVQTVEWKAASMGQKKAEWLAVSSALL